MNPQEWISKLFSADSGVSSMRIMAFVSLIVGSILAFIGVFKGSDLMGLATLCGVFVGSAFAGKAVQKASELKNGE